MTVRIVAVAATSLSCGGGSDPGAAGCRANTECAQALVCVVPSAGGPGTCRAVPLQIVMTTPAPDARIGAAGTLVTAHVTLGAAGAVPPATLTMLANGDAAGTIAQKSQSGADVLYEGQYVPPAGATFNGPFLLAAQASAGLVLSNAIAVAVDAKAPVLALVGNGVTCTLGGTLTGTCPRDGLLHVSVTAQEDNPALLEVALDLDGFAAAVPFAPAPQGFIATVALGKYPFPTRSFSRQVQLRVRARDSFGNESTLDLDPLPVTRLRWTYDAGAPVTGAAITSAGEAVVGVSSTTDNLRVVKPDGTEASRTTLAPPARSVGSFVRSAPSVGATTIWVGSEDGRLYGRSAAGNVFSCPGTPSAGAVFTPMLFPGAPETAFAPAAGAQRVIADQSTATCSPVAGPTSEVPTGAALLAGSKLFVPTVSGVGAGTIRTFAADLTPGGTVSPIDGAACGRIDAALARDSHGIVAACSNGKIFSIEPTSLTPTLVASTAYAALESIVVLPDGDLIVGANDGKVHRLTPPAGGTGTWTEAWTPPTFTSPVTGTLVAEPDAAGVTVYAVSATGALDAIADDGTVQWSIPEASALGAFPLTFPTIAPAPADPNTLPTLYVGSGEGKLYAVVVDKGLDPASPWPKSHHDIRNTGNGNADAPLP